MAAFSNSALAQQIDIAGGLDSIFAPPGSQATGNHQAQSLDGGAYPTISGDVLLFKDRSVGVQGEFAWKSTRATYAPGELNLPYRPLFWDVNAIWAPRVTKRISLELVGGIGEQMTRFYTGSSYASSNHLMADFGGGIKMYAWRHFFIRPEGRIFLVHNNLEFSSARSLRYGLSIGYTFKQKK